jgi:hypothetical protein
MNFAFLYLPKKSSRAGLSAVVVLALALHGFIPAGYMPDAHSVHEPFAMAVCNGMGPMDMAAMQPKANPDPAKKNGDGQKFQDHAPCPFSVNAVFAFGGLAPCCAVPFAVFIVLNLLAAFVFMRTGHFGNASPRAPPLTA